MRGWKDRSPGIAPVFIAYALLTLVMTYPVVIRLSTHLIGDGDDMWVHFWNSWWVDQVIQEGGDLYHTPLLFHPTGVSLRHQNIGWVNAVLWLALEPAVGGIVAYNVVHLIHIPLCGLGMFLLARYLMKSDSIAFLSGLVYAFWPFRMLDTNHPNTVSTEGFPILMLVLLHLFREGRPIRAGIIAGLVLAVTGYMRWQLLILAGFMVVLYALYGLGYERERWSRKTVVGLALMGVVATGLMLPGLYPFVQEGLAGGLPERVKAVVLSQPEQDLVAWIIPQHQHALGGFFTQLFDGYGRTPPRHRYSAYLGYVVIGLTAVGVVKRRQNRDTWFWLVLALLCFTLSLGPQLRFDNVEYANIPLPYRLLEWAPPVQMLGDPRRFSALLGVPLAVLAGYGALSLRRWLVQRRWGSLLAHPMVYTGVLGLLLLVDYYSIPTATVSTHIPSFYSTLAEESGDFAIIELPGNRQATEYYMFCQTTHGRPLLGGHVSRLPSQALDYESSVPLLRGMYESGTGRINTEVPDVSRQLAVLAEAGFRYIIMHKDMCNPGLVPEWQSYLAMSPLYEDDEVAVYSTAPVVGKDSALRHDLGAGVGLIEVGLSADNARQDPALEITAVWGATAPPRADLQVEIALVSKGGASAQVQCFDLSPTWLTTEWPADTIVRHSYVIEAEPGLGEGVYSIDMGLVRRSDGQAIDQRETVGEVVALITEDRLQLFPMGRRVGVDFGQELRLLGYNLEVSRRNVRLILHWEALQEMEVAYKFFVHLENAGTGTLAAQADVMPRGWTYPTVEWAAREVVSDEIYLSLSAVPCGEYGLSIGVYHPETRQRLSVDSAPPGFVAYQDRLELPELIAR